MACLVERAPCFPRRMCSISSRTNSPAWVLGAFPLRASRRARLSVLRSGMSASHFLARDVVRVEVWERLFAGAAVIFVPLPGCAEARNCASASSQWSRSRPSGRPRSIKISYARAEICSCVGVELASLICLAISVPLRDSSPPNNSRPGALFSASSNTKSSQRLILNDSAFSGRMEQWGEDLRMRIPVERGSQNESVTVSGLRLPRFPALWPQIQINF